MMEATAGGSTDLLMECDEEEQEVWPPESTERPKEEKGKHEGWQTAVSVMQDEEEDIVSQPVRIIPIPVQPVKSCSPPKASSTVKSAGAPLGFMVNGRRVPLLPGGGGAELKLHSHPRGSASGFTTVQIPVTLTLHSPAGTQHINTTASLTAAVSSSTSPAAPATPDPTPIITGVVSGEAAQKVLSDHNVNFKSSPSPMGPKTPPSAVTSSKTTPPHKLLRKGELGPVTPPDCLVCRSQYKLITELRGYMCLCSPAIAQSLQNLKQKKKHPKHYRRSRENKTSSKVSRTRPRLSATSRRLPDDFLSDQFLSSTPPFTTFGPVKKEEQPGPLPEAPHGKLVILVEDFYYGSAPGRGFDDPKLLSRKFSGPYRCIHCAKMLRNNIKLMSHMQLHHMSSMDSQSSCPHCFRHFASPFRLHCHLVAVHKQNEPTVTCRICEMAFSSEQAFLWHMKTTHKPGEMPYVCQVCDFRSSFYSDVWLHFQEAHADTRHLLCQYCLRVLRSNTCYQQHFARHQKKHVLGCDKCRLCFLYIKERVEHRALHHRTHIRPPQLSGLKPGTKVTVRTYSVVGGSENEEEVKKKVAPCKVVDVSPPPPAQEAPKRKKVESLGPLLSSLSPDRISRPFQHCIECVNLVPDLRTHFPSLVRCSLCRFITCCSTSYANHMINNHATCRKNPQYQTIFKSDPRLPQRLRCVSCTLYTNRGDVMANHLTEKPDHTCIVSTYTEPSVNGGEKHNLNSVTSSRGRGGTFIPIHLVPPGQNSTQLSVKPLTSPSPLCSPPAMTIKFLGLRPQTVKPPVSSLSVPQLSTILTALCHGVSQASLRYKTPPTTIQSWIGQQLRCLDHMEWGWKTDNMAEWVLSRREQQLTVGEDVLLLTAKRTLGEDSQLLECYSWTVDFMLRHDLGLQTCNNNKLRNITDNSHAFIRTLCSKIQDQHLHSHFFGCMDELPVFIDPDQFSNQNLSAFKLFGSPKEKPVFDIVLSALSDGRFLPPLLFFQGTVSPLPEGFPDNVLLEARQEELPEQDRLQIWVNKVWRPHVASQLGESLLMVDIHRGHVTRKFRDALSSTFTEVVFIPSGCSARLQPLDVCVTPVVRDFLQARWINLVSDGGLGILDLDQLALTLACWLSEVTSTLNSQSDIIRRSFSLIRNLEQGKDGGEATRMIKALTDALKQPLDTTVLETEPEHLELLLVTEERKEDRSEHKQEEREVEVAELIKSLPALRQVLDGNGDQESFHGFQDA
uniref:C2H2-type domain-containing protein n=1 Tax=Stegastes partitus TaxID=144197 RepID=A0A3B4ZII1_9TELE